MICANLCSQNRAQEKRHAENVTNLRKELTKERGNLKKARADTTDCLGMLEEAFADDSAAPPTKRPKSATALLARYRKQLSRARQQNAELHRQLEALQVHAEEQLESRDAAISSAQALATAWEVQCEELETLVDALQPTVSTAETMVARSEEVSNFLPQTKDRHGVYVPRIRTMYFKMLAAGVGTARCQPLLRSLLKLAGVPGYDGAGPLAPHRQLPGKTTAKEMPAQMAALHSDQAARRLNACADGDAALGGDGAMKAYGGMQRDNYGFVVHTSTAGPGTDVDSRPLTVLTMAAKDAGGHIDTYDHSMEQMSEQWNRNQVEHGLPPDSTAASFKRKMGNVASDSDATQQCMDRNILRQHELIREHPLVSPALAGPEQAPCLAEPDIVRVEPASTGEQVEPTEDGSFHPLASFGGARLGYVFQAGPHGVGYYANAEPVRPRKKRATAAAAATTSNEGAIAGPVAPPEAAPAETSTGIIALCWLHKTMKYILAAKETLSKNRRETIISKFEAAAFALEGEDASSPTDDSLQFPSRPDGGGRTPQSHGIMAIWLLCPGPSGRLSALGVFIVNRFCMGLLYGRTGRLTAPNGVFGPGSQTFGGDLAERADQPIVGVHGQAPRARFHTATLARAAGQQVACLPHFLP